VTGNPTWLQQEHFLISPECERKFCSKAQQRLAGDWTGKEPCFEQYVHYPLSFHSDIDSKTTVMYVSPLIGPRWHRTVEIQETETNDVGKSFSYGSLIHKQHPQHNLHLGTVSKLHTYKTYNFKDISFLNTAPTRSGLAPKWRQPTHKQQVLKPLEYRENARDAVCRQPSPAALPTRAADQSHESMTTAGTNHAGCHSSCCISATLEHLHLLPAVHAHQFSPSTIFITLSFICHAGLPPAKKQHKPQP